MIYWKVENGRKKDKVRKQRFQGDFFESYFSPNKNDVGLMIIQNKIPDLLLSKSPTGLNQSSWDLRLWSFRIQMRGLKQLSLTPIWLNFDWERNNFETIRTKRCIDELKLHLHWTVIDGFKIYEVIAAMFVIGFSL